MDRPMKGTDGYSSDTSLGPKKGRITFWVIVAIILLLLAGCGAVALYVWNGLRPAPEGEAKRVEIERGMTAFQVADMLEQQGIIRNSFLFKYYLRYKDEGNKFQAGIYELHPGMTNDEIVAKLNAGETVKPETIRFTVPEGYSILQMAEKLDKEKLADKEEFLRLVDDPKLPADSSVLQSIPKDGKLRYRLEGYLFPETYEFPKDSTLNDMIVRMVSELERKLNELPEGWKEKMAARGLNFHQLMTVASLVEREVVVDEERALVAGVIYNRLAKGMLLQIDATVQYALGEQKERLLYKDLEIDDPYNTYKYEGLPPGPIASPSLASIEAALYPAKSDYLFYVTKKDGSGEHLFARTFEEHERNIEESNRTAKRNGGGEGAQ